MWEGAHPPYTVYSAALSNQSGFFLFVFEIKKRAHNVRPYKQS
jgi:hypothetical protein